MSGRGPGWPAEPPRVRRARHEDAEPVARLLYASSAALYDRYAGGREAALRSLQAAFGRPDNTASAEVLACLPGVSHELAQAIVSHRKSAGFFPNIAWILKVDGMSREIFKQVAPLLSARSDTIRILSEGQVSSTGARQRIQVIVRLRSSSIETVSYREDL